MRACPIRRASPTKPAPGICARRSTTWGSRRAASSPRSRSIACSSAPAPIPASRTCGPRLRCSRGATSKVPGLVSAGSSLVKRQAEEEGLDRIFRAAGSRMGRVRLLHVRRHERRSGRARGTLRLDHQSQFPRPARSGRAHASDVAGDGGGGGGHRTAVPTCGRSWPAGRSEAHDGQVHPADRDGLSARRRQSQHRPDRSGALSQAAARGRLWRGAAARPALRCGRARAAGLPAQPAGLARRPDHRGRAQFRLRLLARGARSMRSTTTASAA